VETTFAFNQGGFSGERKEYNPKGFVVENTGNAVWGMQFIWPIKADYRIVHLDDDYEKTIIGRNARDYVWVMARTPQISDADYEELIAVVESLGYDLDKIRKSPHRLAN
jgi:apolipoprotein D and lipocalin family protein